LPVFGNLGAKYAKIDAVAGVEVLNTQYCGRRPEDVVYVTLVIHANAVLLNTR
jgi:hypothetical protein